MVTKSLQNVSCGIRCVLDDGVQGVQPSLIPLVLVYGALLGLYI